MTSPLKICIDAREAGSRAGGIGTFALSLARAVSNLSDGDEEYFFLVDVGEGPELERNLGSPLKIIEAHLHSASLIDRVAAQIPHGRGIWNRLRLLISQLGGSLGYSLAKTDGNLDREKIDVIHFTTQKGFFTDIPFIYHPHDLQHRHLPEYFSREERFSREHTYRTLCERASIISVASQWVKRDLQSAFRLPDSKIRIVHYAPEPHTCSLASPEVAKKLAQKFLLPQRFIFYPSRTWPHKNHLRLLRSLKTLQDDYGMTVPLVCSGEPTAHLEKIQSEAEALGLNKQVFFLGFLTLDELSALYQLCSAVVIPTLFEAASFPLWEAFLAERPAACSNVTSLPAQAGDAALVFDPYNVEEIAGALKRLWTDSEFGAVLVERGRENISRFSWDKTARTFRALYRQLGNRRLTEEDEKLLSATPLM
jgi:glycosyltransferase involved in cell wall biosynthesis